jgi:hypothetical protein
MGTVMSNVTVLFWKSPYLRKVTFRAVSTMIELPSAIYLSQLATTMMHDFVGRQEKHLWIDD